MTPTLTDAQRRVLERMVAGEKLHGGGHYWFSGERALHGRTGDVLYRLKLIKHKHSRDGLPHAVITTAGRAALEEER